MTIIAPPFIPTTGTQTFYSGFVTVPDIPPPIDTNLLWMLLLGFTPPPEPEPPEPALGTFTLTVGPGAGQIELQIQADRTLLDTTITIDWGGPGVYDQTDINPGETVTVEVTTDIWYVAEQFAYSAVGTFTITVSADGFDTATTTVHVTQLEA